VHEPQETFGLQVFGLSWSGENGLTYATLDEALAAETLVVTEMSEGGSVPTLKLINKGKSLVFLMAGEQLLGAKQNRILNTSLLVPGETELPIPVSCVEAGRWRYHSPKFAGSGTMSHCGLRLKVSKHVHDSYRVAGAPTSNQSEVWAEVTRKLDSLGSHSPSKALYQAYEDQAQRLSDLQKTIQVPEDCSGVAFARGNRVLGVDLFDRPETLAKLWAKIVRAYVLDTLELSEAPTERATPETVARWLNTAAEADAEPFKSPGLGYDVRLKGQQLLGAGLVVEEHPVHVELFSEE
jgi:hypothetical protein